MYFFEIKFLFNKHYNVLNIYIIVKFTKYLEIRDIKLFKTFMK